MLITTAILALLDLDGVGRKTIARILRVPHPDPSNANDLLDWIKLAHSSGIRIAQPGLTAMELSLRRAERIGETCETHGIAVLSSTDERFPPRLRSIPDAPIVIFVKGDMPSLVVPNAIAIIGTRDPTPFGRSAAERLAEIFATSGFVVVSGLAEGCDTHAHLGCLKGGGKTIAVLAHGLDKIYPRKNAELAEQIASTGGCLVSEYPLGAAPQRSYFVERDRLQSGLSQAVIVVETDITGGTMHTVGFCQEQRRVLACLSHPEKMLTCPQTRGNQRLIANGKARPLSNAMEIETLKTDLLRLGAEPPGMVPVVTQPPLPVVSSSNAEASSGQTAEEPTTTPQTAESASKSDTLSPSPESTISSAMEAVPTPKSSPPGQDDFLDALGVPFTPPSASGVPKKVKQRKRTGIPKARCKSPKGHGCPRKPTKGSPK